MIPNKNAVLVSLLLALPVVVHAQFFYTTNNGTITITGYIGADATVVIPSVINGLPVTIIGDYAFQSSDMASVTIPNTVTNIGDAGFEACCSLTNVVIPNSVTSIGDYAFLLCTGLTNITIGSSVSSIGSTAFGNCTSLTVINVDAPNTAYSSVAGVLFNHSRTTLVQYPCGEAGSYTIPNSVTNIGDSAFAVCTGLTNVTIPSSVTSMGDHAFFYCTSLGNVTIPNSVTSIGNSVFQYCSGLTNVIIPNSVTSIGDFAFWDCTNLTSLTIGTSVSKIGNDVFGFCSSLTSLTIPNSVTAIEDSAFYSCTSLASVDIGNGVTNIGYQAFLGCSSLSSVYFKGNAPLLGPGGQQFVGDDATVYYLPGTAGWGSTFGGLQTALFGLPNLLILNNGPSFGVGTNGFGFTINWTSGMTVVVEVSTNIANSTWSPLATNTLTSGSSYFSDPQWTNYLARFYRIRSP